MRLAALTVAARAATGAPDGSTRAWPPICAAARDGRPSSRRPGPSPPLDGRPPGPEEPSGRRDGPGPGRGLGPGHARRRRAPRVGPDVVLGDGPGSPTTPAPPDALVAVPDGTGGYAVADHPGRGQAPGRQGRRVGARARVAQPPGGRARRPLGPHPADHLGRAGLRRDRTPPGARPAGAGVRPVPTAAPSAASCTHRSPTMPAGWPTSTGGRCGCSGRGRTWCDWARSGHRWPAGVDADGAGVLRVGVDRRWRGRRRVGRRPGRCGRGGPGPGRSSRSPCRGLRSPSTCGAPCGPRRPCLAAAAALSRRGREPGPASLWSSAAPGGGRAVARCPPDGSVEVEVDAGRTLDQVVSSAPTASAPPTRPSAGSSPKASPSTRPARSTISPSGRSGSCRARTCPR